MTAQMLSSKSSLSSEKTLLSVKGSKTEVFSPPHPAYTELLLSSVPEMDPD